MTRQDQALILRNVEKWTYKRIADHFGLAEMTVYRWLNPEYREREDRRKRAREKRYRKCEMLRRIGELEERNEELERMCEAWERSFRRLYQQKQQQLRQAA